MSNTTTATLDHPIHDTIELPVRGEGGDPLVARDFGKPHLSVKDGGRLNPLMESDQWNNLLNYTISTVLTGPDAYTTARDLADLIKTPVGEDPIMLCCRVDFHLQ